MQYCPPSDFLAQRNAPMVDVRSPAEFEQGHIPGAVNLPIFSNEERAIVGTLYKRQGQTEALKKGFEIVGPKLRAFTEQALSIGTDKALRVYCWRGGMRSAKMAELFETIGLNCTLVEGGYKAYRKQVLQDFDNLDKMIVLQGPTGSGKTEILEVLQSLGEQTIDLEGLANHRGSAFGGIGMEAQPSTQQFQNDLHNCAAQLSPDQRVWVEGESFKIGKVHLPESFWKIMNDARLISLDMPVHLRVGRLVEDYGHLEPAELGDAIDRLAENFGGKNVTVAQELLATNNREGLAELLLTHYYDRRYLHSREKYKSQKPIIFACSSANANEIAPQLIELANQHAF